MFKKLKEKVSTVTTEIESSARTRIQGLNSQASQYIDQLVNNASNPSKDESENSGKSEPMAATSSDKTSDLLQFNDENHVKTTEKSETSLDNFSLVELDDDSGVNNTSNNGSNQLNSTSMSESESFYSMTPTASPSSHFVPQSDIESEYESETHSRNYSVDNVSKDQLLELCIKLKERGKKYRERWSQVVNAYRLLNDEKEKLKKVLVDTQDKALRKIGEMKEQSNLEQQAKRHLEENLRVVIEEKDEKIKVLQTKIELLSDNNINGETNDLLDLNSNEGLDKELNDLKEKNERLETLLTRCKESLKANKEKVNALNKENEELLDYREKFEKISEELKKINKQNEEKTLSFAEAKQKLHEELEARNIITRDLKDQFERKNKELANIESELKIKTDKINELEDRIKGIETTTEEDKQNLIQELSRGKSATIHLIKEEMEKKLTNLEEEWKLKYMTLEQEKNELNRLLTESESSNKQMILDDNRKQIEETNKMNEQLKNEIKECQTKLNQTIEELNRAQEIRETEKNNLEKMLSDSEMKSSELLGEIQTLNERSANLDELKLELEKTESLLKNAEQKTDDARHELESLRSQLEDKDLLMDQLKEEKMAIEVEFNTKLNALQTQLGEQNIQTEERQSSEDIDLKRDLNDLQNELKGLLNQLNQKNEQIKQLNDKIETSAKNINYQNQRIEKSESDLQKQTDKCLAFEQTIEDFGQKLDQLSVELDEKALQLIEVTEELVLYKQNLNDANNLLNQKELNEIEFENLLKSKDETIETLESETNVLRDKLDNCLKEIERLNEENIRDKQKVSENESIINEIQTKSKHFEEELQKVRNESIDSELIAKSLVEKDSEMSQFKQLLESEQIKNSELISKLNDLNEEKSQLIKYKEELEAIEEKNRQIINENQNLLKSIEEKEISINSLNQELNSKQQSIDSVFNDLQKQLEIKEKDLIDLNNELKSVNEKQLSESQRIESEIRVNQNLRKTIEEFDNKCKELIGFNELVSKEKTDLINEKQSLLSLKSSLEERITSLEKDLENEKTGRKQVFDNKKQINNELKKLKKDFKSLESIKTDLDSKYSDLTVDFESKCKQINELNEIIKKLENSSELNAKQFEEKNNSIKNIESELNQKTDLILNLEKDIKTKDQLIERLNENIKQMDVLSSDLEKCKEELIKYKNIESEFKELNKYCEELKSSLAENSIKHLSELEANRTQMNLIKDQNEAVVEKLYKQLELRETQLDDSLMAVESRHNSTTQELLSAKSDNLKLKQEFDDLFNRNQLIEKQLEELNLKLNDLENQNSSDNSNDEKNSVLIEKINSLESKLHEKELEFDERLEKFHQNEDKLIFDYKKQISSLETELNEKNSALEEVHEYYQQRLKDKDNDLKCLHSEFDSSSVNEHTYQVKAMQNSLLQYQEENVRLKELLNIRRFAETHNSEHTPLLSGVHLPEPTEYEYLRNILFEFMIGREPVTLAKVIAAVMRFSSDQTDQIIKKQESNQLSSLRQFKPI